MGKRTRNPLVNLEVANSLQVTQEMCDDWLAAYDYLDEIGVPTEWPDGTAMRTLTDRIRYLKESADVK